jgi:ABC-type transport system substrate-binding protein
VACRPAWPARPGLASAPTQPAARCCATPSRTAETGFDPAKISDLYSRTVTPHIFEALYQYDHLARPSRVKPLPAAAMPEVSADFRTWTVRIRPGIFFADDPAFKGEARAGGAGLRLQPQALCRPGQQEPGSGAGSRFKLVGLAELRQRAIDTKKPFDYDTPIEGLRRWTATRCSSRSTEPRPRFIEFLAATTCYGAVAREVVEFYGDKIAEHPVGTGPFRLAQWRRSSLIVLERNPSYRERLYDAEPAPTTPRARPCWRASRAGAAAGRPRWRCQIIEEAAAALAEPS